MSNRKGGVEMAKFLLHEPRNSMFFFTSYPDENGNEKFLVKRYNRQGDVEKEMIKFPQGKRFIQFPKNKTDKEDNSFYEFVKNSPYCKGAKTCVGEGLFKEYDPVGDAKDSVEENRIRIKAESHALDVQGDDLLALAGVWGVINEENEDVLRNAVLEFAKLQPRKYIETSGAPDLSYRALMQAAIALGYIKNQGFMFYAVLDGGNIDKSNFIGQRENGVIAKLQEDKALYEAIKNKVEEARK